jgi:phage shock protein PspC (stress-responsive transcriptional regulator)
MSTTETTETQAAPIKELHRSRDDRYLAGVAGGLGRYFDVSPAFFRIGFAVLTLVGGAGILLYVAAALVIPNDGEKDSIASEALRRHRDRPWLLVGVALVGIAFVSIVAQADFWPNSGFAWTLLLLGALAIVVAQRRTEDGSPPPDTTTPAAQPRQPSAAKPRQPSIFAPAMGILLAGAGVLALVSATGTDVRWDVALAVGAIATGVAVAAGAYFRRRTGGLVVVGVLLASLAVAVSAIDVELDGPIGDRVYRPISTGDVHRTYEMSIGDLTVDLSDTILREPETEIDASIGIGELTVVVPDDVAVDVEASASAGQVTVFGRQDDGIDTRISEVNVPPGATRTVHIDAHVGLGNVVVARVSD